MQVKILIADDEAMSRRLLQSTLERAGYEVIAVENGRQAAERIEHRGPPEAVARRASLEPSRSQVYVKNTVAPR